MKGQVSLDFGQEAKYVYFSLQKRAVMVKDWLARWANNPSLVRDMAHYCWRRSSRWNFVEPSCVILGRRMPWCAPMIPMPVQCLAMWQAGLFTGSCAKRSWRILEYPPGLPVGASRAGTHSGRGKTDRIATSFQACCKQLWKVLGFSSPTKVWQCWKHAEPGTS